MTSRSFSFGTIAVILAIIPLCMLLGAPIVFKEHFSEILKACGSLVGAIILGEIFSFIPNHFLRTESITNIPFTDNVGVKKTDFNTLPIVAVIFIATGIVMMFVDQSFFNKHFSTILASVGSLISTIIIYAIFGGEYRVVDSSIKQKKK